MSSHIHLNTNRLITEKSPYLLQHAHNPVDWYPWGNEAFQRAREEDKPIFLSIGYSTCHWCHVMERESFEDDRIAAFLNEHFISIKVDREERPDVDKIHMNALHAMGQHGGWPLSMFLTPDLKPFFGGTYYPPVDNFGRIGFPSLLKRIDHLWRNEKNRVLDSAAGIYQFLNDIASSADHNSQLDRDLVVRGFHQFKSGYDAKFGGFGSAPKFPRPVVLEFLFRYYHATGTPSALEMTLHTLRAMANGGMYDQLGWGFHRYSVDREWFVPHFEKMLYDQAQLVKVYLDAYLITNDHFYSSVARNTLDYVLRELTSPEGGFYSAEDADSPDPNRSGQSSEGACYLWSHEEIFRHLNNDDAVVIASRFGIQESGNVLSDPHGVFSGRNILSVRKTISELAGEFGITVAEIQSILSRSNKALLDHRANRPRPHLDDKIITSWNGLMISAFARGYQVLGDERYRNAAQASAQFIFTHLYDHDRRRLKRRYRDGEANHEAYLDDYVYLTHGLLDLYEAGFAVRWLELAVTLTNTTVDLFWDNNGGGFFDTSGDDPSILVRLKEQYDGAEPSGNSMALFNLLRLASMTSYQEWKSHAKRTLRAFAHLLNRMPSSMPLMLSSFPFLFEGMRQILIVGEIHEEKTKHFIRIVRQNYIPDGITMVIDESSKAQLSSFFPFVETLSRIDGSPTAYACMNGACRLPTTDPNVFADQIASSHPRSS